MRVALFKADSVGCGHYRMIFPAEALADDPNVDVTVRSILRFRSKDGPDFDVAVFQRPFSAEIVKIIPTLQDRYGLAVVVDMDDDCSNLPPGHAAFAQLHPKWNPEHNWRNAEDACAMADFVTASTPGVLRRYASHGRGRVLRNCVPESYLEVNGSDFGTTIEGAKEEPLTVGWTGALTVHPGDLEVCRMGIARGLGDARFSAVAPEAAAGFPPDETHRRLQIPEAQRVVAPWADLRTEYPAWVASLDVGIAPLATNGFNVSKSALRGLEMSGLGVPFVASPLPEYRLLASLGAGVLAERPKDWERALRALVGSEELRAEVAGRGREVAAELTYEANRHHWAEAWADALAIRRRTAQAAV